MSKNIIQDFNNLESSVAFSRRAVSLCCMENDKRVVDHNKMVVLNKKDYQWLSTMISLLDTPEMRSLIEQGCITLAAIKPLTQESKLGVAADLEGAEKLLSMIGSPLKVLFTFSTILNRSDIERFYPQEVQDKYSSLYEDGNTVWNNIVNYMKRGVFTYAVLYDPSGNAVETWRNQIGSTDPRKAKTGTIRAKYGLSIMQNLTHGSSGDTLEEKIIAVKQEVESVRNLLEKVKHDVDRSYYSSPRALGTFTELPIVPKTNELVLVTESLPAYQAGAETFLEGYTVISSDTSLHFRKDVLAVKNIVTMGDVALKTKQYCERLQFLATQGVHVPTVFGYKNGAVYQTFIPNHSSAKEALLTINKSPELQKSKLLVMELAKTAAALDRNGFLVIGDFFANMIYDGDTLWFVDGGSDLGSKNTNEPRQGSYESLIKSVTDPEMQKLAKEVYASKFKVM